MRHFVSTRRQFYFWCLADLLSPTIRLCRIGQNLTSVDAFLVEVFLKATFQLDFDAYFEICKPSLRFTGCQLEGRSVCILHCLPACMILCCDLKTAENPEIDECQIIDRTVMKRNCVTTKQKSIPYVHDVCRFLEPSNFFQVWHSQAKAYDWKFNCSKSVYFRSAVTSVLIASVVHLSADVNFHE